MRVAHFISYRFGSPRNIHTLVAHAQHSTLWYICVLFVVVCGYFLRQEITLFTPAFVQILKNFANNKVRIRPENINMSM